MTDHADVIRQALDTLTAMWLHRSSPRRAYAALDALVAERDALVRRLRDAPLGGNGSHWDGCWRSHIDCAVARVKELEVRDKMRDDGERHLLGEIEARDARVKELEAALRGIEDDLTGSWLPMDKHHLRIIRAALGGGL